MRLPRLDSATWRGIITALQTLGSLLVALVAIPEVMDVLTQYYPAFVPVVITGAGIISFIINLFRKDVKNY